MRNKVSSPASFTSGLKKEEPEEIDRLDFFRKVFAFITKLIGVIMGFKLDRIAKIKLKLSVSFLICSFGFPYLFYNISGWIAWTIGINLFAVALYMLVQLLGLSDNL